MKIALTKRPDVIFDQKAARFPIALPDALALLPHGDTWSATRYYGWAVGVYWMRIQIKAQATVGHGFVECDHFVRA